MGRLIVDINNLLAALEEEYNNEQALRKKVESVEKQLRQIFDSTSAGLFQLDEKGRLLTFNQTFEKILRRTLSVDFTNNVSLSSLFYQQPEFNELIKEALESDHLVSGDFSLRVEKGEDDVWVHCLLSAVTNSLHQTFIEGVIFDVTRRVE